MKQCKTCGQTKELSEFWYNPKTKDRLKTSCIQCCKEYNKQHYQKNREERIEQITEWKRRKHRQST